MDKKAKLSLSIQRNVILVLVVLLIFASTGTITFAVYTRFVQENTNITLSNPVRIYITSGEQDSTVVLPEGTAVYPGTKVTLNLGFDLEEPSSPAFIRAKIEVTSDAFIDDGGTLIEEGLVVFGNGRPNPDNWVLVDFNYSVDHSTKDLWYVYVSKVDEPTTKGYNAKPYTQEDEVGTFINGTIKISSKLTNEFANKKINIKYSVTAIQTANIVQPISVDSKFYTIINEDGITERVYIGTWGEAIPD